VAGAWLANSTLGSVSGSDCLSTSLQTAAGRRDVFTTAVTQQGATLGATIASQGNGTLCAYSGSAFGTAVSLQLTSCQSGRVTGLSCGDGQPRELQLASGTLTATADAQAGTGSGRDVTTWNVLQPGGTVPVGTLTMSANFTWIFLGLPSSDYHVFTGNVFPGYADGTISIPADPNQFCLPCGWFVGP
jgi:hypothetical protein